MPDATPMFGLRYPNDADTLKAALKDVPRMLAQDLEATIAGLQGVPGQNLIANPSFEVDASGWAASNGTLTSVAESAVEGSRVGAFTSTSSGSVTQIYVPALTPCAEGDQFTAAAWIKQQVSAVDYRISILWYNGGTILSSTAVQVPSSSLSSVEFRRLMVQGTAPANATQCRLAIQSANPLPVGSGFRVDAAFFGRGLVVPTIGDTATRVTVTAPSNSFTTTADRTSYSKVGSALDITMQLGRASGWFADTTLFILPVGFRPSVMHHFVATNQTVPILIRVGTNGKVDAVTPYTSGSIEIIGSTTLLLR